MYIFKMGDNQSKTDFRVKYNTYLMKQDEYKKYQFHESTISYLNNNNLPIKKQSLHNLVVYVLTKSAKDVPKETLEIWRDKENKKDESDDEEEDHFVMYVLKGKIQINEEVDDVENDDMLNVVMEGDYEKYSGKYNPHSLCIPGQLKDFFENNKKDDEGFYIKNGSQPLINR